MKRLFSMMLFLCLAFSLCPSAALAADSGVTIQKTDIQADTAGNTGGYGSLLINERYYEDGDDWDWDKYEYGTIPPKAALIDRNGQTLFPYKETWMRYYYSDGIVSLTGDAYIEYADEPEFYDVSSGKKTIIQLSDKMFGAYRMNEGYAFLLECERQTDAVFAELTGAYFVDKQGKKILALDDSFSDVCGLGFSPYGTHYVACSAATVLSDGLILCYSFDEDHQIVTSMRYIDISGQTVLTLPVEKYSEAWIFSEGYALVHSGSTGLYGFIDKNGKEVIPCEYDGYNTFFQGGYAAVSKNGSVGYINAKNEVVIPFEYDDAYGYGEGLFAVVKNGKCGLVDKNNKVVVPFEYDDISSYEDGVAYAVKDRTVYIITGYSAEGDPAGKAVSAIFSDVGAGVWYEKYLQAAYDSGIIGGMPNGTYDPSGSLTHAQIMVMAANLHSKQKGDDFKASAVSGDHWAAAFRDYCKREGIIDDRFDASLDELVNRSEMAYYFANTLKASSYKDKQSIAFKDIAGNAYEAEITKLAKADIVGGKGDGIYDPEALVTRAEAAVFISNILDAIGE